MKKEKKIILRNYIILIIFMFLIFNLSYAIIRNYMFYSEWKEKYTILNDKLISEKIKQKEIIDKKEMISKDRGIEKELLDKYLLQKPGEKVVRILD